MSKITNIGGTEDVYETKDVPIPEYNQVRHTQINKQTNTGTHKQARRTHITYNTRC